MTQFNDIITNEDKKLYADTAVWCNENGAVLKEIEPKDDIRRFRVVSVPTRTEDEKKAAVRAVRNQYLAETDKYMLPDYPVSEEERARYRTYREYLRDYTKNDSWFEKEPAVFECWCKKN